ncbi:unnamed protein product, partial [marine sediment metagenome]
MNKAVLFILTLLVFIGIGVGGYYFINQQMQKKLEELETEVKTTGEAKQVVKEETTEKRNIILPDQPKVEKNSSFFLKTDKETYTVNESFNLDVIVKAPGAVIDGAEFVLNYDPQLVEAGELISGSFFSLYPQKKVDP